MSSSDSDSGPDDREVSTKKKNDDDSDEVEEEPKSKRQKKDEKKSASGSSKKKSAKKDDEDDERFEIGPKRFVSVGEFRGNARVDIREFYNDKDTNELKPGKKGINLSVDQWKKLKKLIPSIDAKLEEI